MTLYTPSVSRAVCRNFVKGILKSGGAQLQVASGGALEDNVLKIRLVILRRGEIDTRGGGGRQQRPVLQCQQSLVK